MTAGQNDSGTRVFGFGVVGAGNIAAAHIDAIEKLPNARLVGVTSRSRERAEMLARQHGSKFYDSHDSMLADSDVEVVNICTPSGSHRDPAIATAKAGRHVVVEKPLEITSGRAKEIIAAADEAGVYLPTIFMSRFSDAYQQLKKAVDEGQLGRLLQGDADVKWYRSQAYYDSAEWRGTWLFDGGGALMNQAIHQIDLLQWIMGPVTEVFCYAEALNHERIEVEDTAVAVLRFSSGALGSVRAATSLYPGQPSGVDIHGEGGTVRIQDGTIVNWQLAGLSEAQQKEVVASVPYEASGTFADPMAMSFENHRRQLEDFLDAIETNSAPLVDGREGLRSVEIIEAFYQSAKSGEPVRLEPAS